MKTIFNCNKSRASRSFKGGVCVLMTLFLVACGGGGSDGSTASPVVVVEVPVVEPTIYTVSGSIIDETENALEGALVTVAGIQAVGLTDAQGLFSVQSELDFTESAVVTVTRDGYESFSEVFTLAIADTVDSYQLDSNVTMAESEPWGYLGVTVTPNGQNVVSNDNFLSALSSSYNSSASVNNACDCTVNLAGRAYKNGEKKSELYILLVVDASGSTADNSINGKTVFDIEIESLTALVDSLEGGEKTHIGVVEFATEASVVVDFTSDLSAVKNALATIVPQTSGTAGAATNYEAALELAKTTFGNVNAKNKDIKTIAFMSDGVPTAPYGSGNSQQAEDRIAAIDAASGIAGEGITINTFPVNILSNLTTLPSISAITEGIYYQHDSNSITSDMKNDSLVGIIGVEIVNETTTENALDLVLRPDGRFEGNICLTAGEKNTIKITPAVCDTCEKVAYQKVTASCTAAEECSTCAGQVTNLELTYTGLLAGAEIEVLQPKNANKSYTLFEGTVEPGERFEFFGAAKDKTMGSSITVLVNGVLNAEFVTSCGQLKIGPGRISGDFEVFKGYSRNGGLLCPIE